MSRLVRYQQSLERFIKDRSCLKDTNCVPNVEVESLSYNYIKKSNWILSILLLTIMNNQNKKKQISLQGYYAATSVEFLYAMTRIIDCKEQFCKNYGFDNYSKIINYFMTCSNLSLCQNLESIKDIIGQRSSSIFLESVKAYNNSLSFTRLLNDDKLELDETEPKPDDDLLKWYIKDDKKLADEFINLKRVKHDSLKGYIDKKLGSLVELSLCLGWILGCGEIASLDKIKNLSKCFAMIYKLSEDFDNIEEDICNNQDGVTLNYVVNYGLQKSYETFMQNKQKFLEEVMILDIYTTTIKEIMNYIEQKVDNVIDDTSPDIKSNFSNIYTVSLG